MSITVNIEPSDYSAGYSAIPLKFSSSNVGDSTQFKYLVNICYDSNVITADVAVAYGANAYTQLTVLSHPYKVGDVLLITDTDDDYTGYYNVVSVPTPDTFIVNLVLGTPITGTLTAHKVIKYKVLPDLEGYCKLDISNVLKDFVTQNLEDTTGLWAAPDTEFSYQLFLGEEKRYSVEFEDNGYFYPTYGDAGKISFYNTAILSLADTELKVGDKINIQQDLAEWDYDTAYNDSGFLAFSDTTNVHNFRVGQTVNVGGQVTEPGYNGPATITSVSAYPASLSMTTNKPWVSVPASYSEGTSIFGTPVPEYNTVATIVDLNWDATYGLIISTDIPFQQATQPIGGTITYASNNLLVSPAESNLTGKTVYNAHLNRLDYASDGFEAYVSLASHVSNEALISTILSQASTALGVENRYRVEQSTKSSLLMHSENTSLANRAMIYAYDAADNVISQERIDTAVSGTSLYTPIGLDVIMAGSTTLIAGSALSTVIDDVVWYAIAFCDTSNVIKSNYVAFELNNDCSRYEIHHLMWKDRYGSWLSYPFKYMSKDITEFDRKSYYQSEGQWGSTDFTYDSFGRGEKGYFGRSRDKYILNSGFIEEFENELIKDLLSSTSVYIQLPDNTLVGCIIDNKQQEFYKKNNMDLYNYTLTVRVSSNEVRY